jgi:hypothetical protein
MLHRIMGKIAKITYAIVQSKYRSAMDPIANPDPNDDPGTVIVFPEVTLDTVCQKPPCRHTGANPDRGWSRSLRY